MVRDPGAKGVGQSCNSETIKIIICPMRWRIVQIQKVQRARFFGRVSVSSLSKSSVTSSTEK
jgi:hypothetical protein